MYGVRTMSRPFPNSPAWKIIDLLGDHTAISKSIHVLSLQCGFFDHIYDGAFNLGRFWWKDTPSLFMNGVLFFQLRLPFWVGLQLRLHPKYLFQTGLGWKANGRLAMLFRVQTDTSAAIGMDGPNTGQATGFNDGTH